jgi:FkbM family methyltransferase
MAASLRKLRPAKIRNAFRRRRFEYLVPRLKTSYTPALIALGTSYGEWTVPSELIQPSWICYCVGAGGDISFDLGLIRRYGVEVRAVDPVAYYIELAQELTADEPRFLARQVAIAASDGPIRMQITHDPRSRSVSSAQLYESSDFIDVPGRTLPTLMAELGDPRIDLLKFDVEGAEYEILPTVDLRALGVKVLAIQLHHTGSVREARKLIAALREQAYEPVACRSVVKLTFVHRDLL